MSTGRGSPVRQPAMRCETRRFIRLKASPRRESRTGQPDDVQGIRTWCSWLRTARRRQRRRVGDAWSYFNGAADFSQVIPEGQRRRLLALSKVRIKLNLVAQGNASTHALGLTRFSVANRLCEREDIRCDGQWNEKHPI